MRVPLLVACLQPLNLAVLGLAIIAGLVLAIWLLPVGLVCYALLVFLSQRDSGLLQQINRPAPVKRPDKTVFQPQIDSAVHTQTAIQQSVAAADPVLRRSLAPTVAQIDQVVADAFALATKGQLLVDYLGTTSRTNLNAQLHRTQGQLRTATDPMLQKQYGETITALQDRLQNLDALTTYRDRIAAQLDNICVNLDNILSETMRLRTAGAASADPGALDVSNRLSDLRADMDAFSHVLDTAMTGVV